VSVIIHVKKVILMITIRSKNNRVVDLDVEQCGIFNDIGGILKLF
jgi:hypothetical protein